MRIQLKSYSEKFDIFLPDDLDIVVQHSKHEKSIENPVDSLLNALNSPYMTKPLKKLLENAQIQNENSDDYICILISFNMPPTICQSILKLLENCFKKVKIPDTKIKVLLATGMHPKPSPKYMKRLLGVEFLSRFDIIAHNAQDEKALTYCGDSPSGAPVYLNRYYFQSKFKILVAAVEPHPVSGFTGGNTLIVPGISGVMTTQAIYSEENLRSAETRYGILKSNPIYKNTQEILKMAHIKPNFVIEFVSNAQNEILKIGAGAYQVHDQIYQYVKRNSFFPITKQFDVSILPLPSAHSNYPEISISDFVSLCANGEIALKSNGILIMITKSVNSPISINFKGDSPKNLHLLTKLYRPLLTNILSKISVIILSPQTSFSEEWEKFMLQIKCMRELSEALNYCKAQFGDNFRVLVIPEPLHCIPQKL